MPKLDDVKDTRLLDKKWRLTHLYKITTKDGKLIKFKPNRAQVHFEANRGQRNIILKSRQLGFTTYEAVDMLDDILFTPNTEALLIAYDQDTSKNIFDKKISLCWENFPPALKELYTVDADRTDQLKVGFGDGRFSSVVVKSSGRSGTYQRLHISEYAKTCKHFPDKADEILTGSIPSVPLNGRVDIESTAEGEFGHFYDLFWEAWNHPTGHLTDYKAHFYNWTWDDEEIAKVEPLDTGTLPQEFLEIKKTHNLNDRQISYYYVKWLALKKDWKKLRQEYPTTPEEAFQSSGDKLFAVEPLEKMVLKDGTKEGDWTIYEDFNPLHRYAIGADVAEGVGKDSSTAVIFDFTKSQVVGEFASNKIAPDIFAYELKNYGHRFGTCLIAVERNNHGFATLTKLKDIYPINQIYKEIRRGVTDDTPTERLGWHTNMATKPEMLYDLSTAINEGMMLIPSRPLIFELRTYDKQDLQVLKGNEATKHWDRVIALAISWQMRNHAENRYQLDLYAQQRVAEVRLSKGILEWLKRNGAVQRKYRYKNLLSLLICKTRRQYKTYTLTMLGNELVLAGDI